jgi:hypothetical protein
MKRYSTLISVSNGSDPLIHLATKNPTGQIALPDCGAIGSVNETKQEVTCPACREAHGMLPLDQVVYLGFTQGQLEAAIAMVQNKENWKLPINAIVKNEDIQVTLAAINYFAGGACNVTHLANGTAHITAPGYYALIGA